MISLTRLNGSTFYLNAELIRMVEATPDTVVTLVNETKLVVREPVTEVVERVIVYRRKANTPFPESVRPSGLA